MRIEDLELFVEVARRGSFAAVARDRLIDPSSLSRIIAGLEAQIAVRLFQRTTRRMRLTEAGSIYLARIEALLEELARAQNEAANASVAPRGTLRLTASVTFGQKLILPLLPSFRRQYPSLQVECIFTDANLDLVKDGVDLAIRLAPEIEGDLVASKLMETRYRVVASPSYLEAAPELANPSDLSHHRCILFALAAFRSRWIFRSEGGRIIEVPVDGDVILSPAGSLRDAALADLGPALLPDWLVDEDIAAGRLVQLLPEYAATATTFDTGAWFVYPSRAFLPNKVRVAIDFIRASIARRNLKGRQLSSGS
jgi:DNA-binding transcriptional LysR family regulator